MIDAGIVSVLSGDATVTAICATRFFQMDAPPDVAEMPCLTYMFVGGSSQPTLGTSGVIRQRVQLDAHSLDADKAKDLSAAIVNALLGWSGTLTNGVHVLLTELLNPGTDFVNEQRIFRRMVEFYVSYTLPA